MLQKSSLAWLAVLMLPVALANPVSATLVTGPKSLTGALSDLEETKLLRGLPSFDLRCMTGKDRCRGVEDSVLANSGFLKADATTPAVAKPRFGNLGLAYDAAAMKQPLDRLLLDAHTLMPFAHTVFCLEYPQDCVVRKIAFRGQKFQLTPARMQELMQVNGEVNRDIRPERNTQGLAGEKWIVSPSAGDCNDYAVTKQHELLARGWPSRTLLLAEVVTNWGEHHLVVVVRTAAGDLLLDNLTPSIRPWSKAPYRWVRVQSPTNPKAWMTVR